jgi:hypothetical protein
MAVLDPMILGSTGKVTAARVIRLAKGAVWRPSAAALGAVSGVVYGPAGSMLELTLVNPTTVGANPGVAVIQGTHSTSQGQYEVTNDAYATLAVTAQHASQYRRALVVIGVDDAQAAGVTSTATTDRPRLTTIDGALSASAPGALPALPANYLALGEVGIPPTGQTVTLTPYNPRTVTRGGILPVVNDASTTPGHGAEAGAYTGQYRDHPTLGLQRWTGTRWYAPTEGYVSQTTDISGNIIVPHSLGVTPTGVLITPQQQSSDAIQRIVSITATSRDATNFVAYVIRRDTNAPFAQNPITFAWRAFV